MPSDTASAVYRWVAGLVAVAAVAGWGSFFFLSASSASVQEAHAQTVQQLQQERSRLGEELGERRAKAAEIADLEAKLAAVRSDLARVTQTHEQAKAALASVQSELAAGRAELASRREELAAVTRDLTQVREELTAAEQTASVKASGNVQKRKKSAKRTGKRTRRASR